MSLLSPSLNPNPRFLLSDRECGARRRRPGRTLSTANGLWVDQSLKLKPDFRDLLHTAYKVVFGHEQGRFLSSPIILMCAFPNSDCYQTPIAMEAEGQYVCCGSSDNGSLMRWDLDDDLLVWQKFLGLWCLPWRLMSLINLLYSGNNWLWSWRKKKIRILYE